METKICKGKHGCGRALPLDQFGTNKVKRFNKTLNIVIYTEYYRSHCLDCQRKNARNWYNNNIERSKENNKKYRASPQGIENITKRCKSEKGRNANREAAAKYRDNNRQQVRENQRRFTAKNINRMRDKSKFYANLANVTLSDTYIKEVLKKSGYINITPDMIHIKRLILKIKRLQKQERHEQLSESK